MKRKVVALMLAGMMISGSGTMGHTVYAAESQDTVTEDTASTQSQDTVNKSESVYVTAKANGTAKEIKVKETLKNPGTSESLEDYSELQNIRNTDGEETYGDDGDGNLVWENQGKDISYEGETDKKLPVSVKVRYYLNGKEKKAKEMAGVFGKVKIRFEYTNQATEEIDTDGEKKSVAVPFTALSAVMLPSDTFSNVEVSNGKVMDQDGQSIVLGLAFPGLSDSLGLKDYEPTEDIDLPDYVEITADAKNFSLDFTATILSSGLLSDLEDDDLKDADDLTESMEKLTDASSKLVDGTDELASGLSQMQSYLGEYTSGMDALNSGVQGLNTALGTLDTNGSKLTEGATQIKNGLGTLSGALGKVQIPSGTAQISEEAANVGQNAESTLQKLEGLKASVQSAEDMVTGIDTASINEQIRTEAANLAKSQLDTTLSSMVEKQEITEEQKAQIISQYQPDMASLDISGYVQNIKDQLSNIQGVLTATNPDGLMASLNQLNASVTALKVYTDQLSAVSGNVAYLKEALTQLNGAVAKLSAGSENLTSGIEAYASGVSQIYNGAQTLGAGTQKLAAAGSQLNTGMSALATGGNTLAEAMKEFDKEGIQKLGNLAGDDLKQVIQNVKDAKKADEAYQSFGGIKEGQKGEVKFIIETKEIKKK